MKITNKHITKTKQEMRSEEDRTMNTVYHESTLEMFLARDPHHTALLPLTLHIEHNRCHILFYSMKRMH